MFQVLIFAFPDHESQSLFVIAEWQGTQLGENFGAALAAADINGDGLSDLVVGSPMYSLPDIPDMGKIQVYLSSRVSFLLCYKFHHLHAVLECSLMNDKLRQ